MAPELPDFTASEREFFFAKVIDNYQKLLEPIAVFVSSQTVSASLADELNRRSPADSEKFNAIEHACHAAVASACMCAPGLGGRRFGRVIEATYETGRLSIEVVDLKNTVGPHHRHPAGAISMIMPVTRGARFDGIVRGWCVFEPGSDHCPTVTNGEALVLYMLPEGKIEFSEQ